MSYAQNLWFYFVLLSGIIIVPGMDMAFVVTNAVTRGRSFGLAATFGIMLGGAVHAMFGALAVGVLSRLPAFMITTLLIAGSLYMAWIGWNLLCSTIVFRDFASNRANDLNRVFWQGTMTCLLNPKAYLFVLAIYPQFILPQFGPVAWQAVVMGALTLATQLTIYGGLALVAGQSRTLLSANPQLTRWIGRSAGALFLAAACLTALSALRR